MYYGNKLNSKVIDRVAVKNPHKCISSQEIEKPKGIRSYFQNVNWKMILGYGGLALFFVFMIVVLHLIV